MDISNIERELACYNCDISSFKLKDQSAIFDKIRKTWQNIENKDDRHFIQLSLKLVKQTRLIGNDKITEQTLNSIFAFIRTLQGTEFYETFALSTLKAIILTDSDMTQSHYQQYIFPVTRKLLNLILNEYPINPDHIQNETLLSLLELCLTQNRKDFELADQLRALKPKDDIISLCNPKTGETLLQRFSAPGEDGEAIEYLLKNGADPNRHGQGTTPFIIKIVKVFSENFLNKLGKYDSINPYVTDQDGRTAHYHLIIRSNKCPPALCLDVTGLPQEVANFFDPSFYSDIWESDDYLQVFLEAWRNNKTEENKAALTQATILFFDLENRGLLFSTEYIGQYIELLLFIRDIPLYENIALNLLKKFLNRMKDDEVEVVARNFNILVETLDFKKIPLNDAVDILLNSLKIGIQDDCIANIVLRLRPDIINAEMTDERGIKTPIGKACKNHHSYAVDYLLKHGADISKEPQILNIAVKTRDVNLIKLLIDNHADVNQVDEVGNTPLHTAIQMRSKEIIELLLNNKNTKLDVVNYRDMTPIQLNHEIFTKTGFSNALIKRFPGNQFLWLYKEYKYFLQTVHGVSEKFFHEIIEREKARLKDDFNDYLFTKDSLITFSHIYTDFWKTVDHDIEHFDKYFEDFPLKNGLVCFLKEQKELYDQMHADRRMKDFPIDQLWRYAIDYQKEGDGPCAFEDEPGYLKSFFIGMKYAIETADKEKTPQWYLDLHEKIISETLVPIIRHARWKPSDSHYTKITSSTRKDICGFSIQSLDQDPFGVEYLKTSKDGMWNFMDDKTHNQLLSFAEPKIGQMEKKLEDIMNTYNELNRNAFNPSQKLMAAIFTARELEINHICEDGNGRAAHLALISMISAEQSLPMFLLPNPNVLDGNGPESLAYRYLEACINFRKGGVGINFKSSKELKKLDSLDLDEFIDLKALRDELKPLVCGKTWLEVRDSIQGILQD